MGEDEICVCFHVEALKISQPKISRHLAYLRRAGLVAARREGKWIHYRVVEPPDPHAAKIFAEVRGWLANESTMLRDRARLTTICCDPQLPVQLQRAPRPASLVFQVKNRKENKRMSAASEPLLREQSIDRRQKLEAAWVSLPAGIGESSPGSR